MYVTSQAGECTTKYCLIKSLKCQMVQKCVMFITCMLHKNYCNKKLNKGSMVNIKLPFDVFLCNLKENNMKRKRILIYIITKYI